MSKPFPSEEAFEAAMMRYSAHKRRAEPQWRAMNCHQKPKPQHPQAILYQPGTILRFSGPDAQERAADTAEMTGATICEYGRAVRLNQVMALAPAEALK